VDSKADIAWIDDPVDLSSKLPKYRFAMLAAWKDENAMRRNG
jgi:hypothetical protein